MLVSGPSPASPHPPPTHPRHLGLLLLWGPFRDGAMGVGSLGLYLALWQGGLAAARWALGAGDSSEGVAAALRSRPARGALGSSPGRQRPRAKARGRNVPAASKRRGGRRTERDCPEQLLFSWAAKSISGRGARFRSGKARGLSQLQAGRTSSWTFLLCTPRAWGRGVCVCWVLVKGLAEVNTTHLRMLCDLQREGGREQASVKDVPPAFCPICHPLTLNKWSTGRDSLGLDS